MMIRPLENLRHLESAKELYKHFWDKVWLGHQEKQVCNFDGSAGDLDMLGYCEYEVGFPEEGYDNAALIWANVIRMNTILEWGQDHSGNIYLYCDKEFLRFAVNVKNYVFEFIYSGISQFESFEFLTEKILIEMLIAGYGEEDVGELLAMIRPSSNYSGDTYSERFVACTRVIYGATSLKCVNLAKLITEDV